MLALATALRLWLGAAHRARAGASRRGSRQIRRCDELDAHQSAADYTAAKTRLALSRRGRRHRARAVAHASAAACSSSHAAAATVASRGEIARGLALIALLAASSRRSSSCRSASTAPSASRSGSASTMTPTLYWIDFAKRLRARRRVRAAAGGVRAVAHAGGGRVLVAVRVGQPGWLSTFHASALYPTWIAPLFNKFSPMQDPDLRERVERLLHRCGFKVKGLFVMDGSKRSSHGNAYFTGFGASQAHRALRHADRAADARRDRSGARARTGPFLAAPRGEAHAVDVRDSLAFLWLLDFLMARNGSTPALTWRAPSTAMALLLFSMVVPRFTFLLQPLSSATRASTSSKADRLRRAARSARGPRRRPGQALQGQRIHADARPPALPLLRNPIPAACVSARAQHQENAA